jgi:hypothetical protein
MQQTVDRFLKVQLEGRGKIYLQVIDESARWGFYVTDGNNVWDGGLNMHPHSYLQVTRRPCPRLDWVRDMISSGVAEPCFNQYALLYLGFTWDVFRELYQIDYPRKRLA